MPLTREQIVDAALQLLDEEGADALSMRRLGGMLDAGAASIYWHVPGKEVLLDLVADRVVAEAFSGFDGGPTWRTWSERAAWAIRDALNRHPGAAPLLVRRPPMGPAASIAASRLLARFEKAGFDPRSAVLASTVVIWWAVASAVRRPGELAASGTSSPVAMAASIAGLAIEHPDLAALAPEISSLGDDDPFAFGLRALLDGIATGQQRRAGVGPSRRGRQPSGR